MRGRFARLAVVVVALAGTTVALDASESRLDYAYDAAGRLVRVADGTGRFVLYRYDPAGNLRGSVTRRVWHVSVKKPAKGAWVLQHAPDGTLEGHGADDQRGFYALTGSLDDSGEGAIQLRDPDTAAVLASFTLSGSSASVSSDTGASVKLVLKGPDGIAATGLAPRGALGGFRGTYASAKNQIRAGAAKLPLGRVDFVEEGTRAGVTLVDGALDGILVRDARGKAYGEIRYEGSTYRVASRLKDGAKTVKAKTGKGAPERLLLKVKP